MTGQFPTVRPRRLRRTPALRRLIAETSLEPRHLVLPMFVREGATEPVPIATEFDALAFAPWPIAVAPVAPALLA